jgi:hypothetical protein
MVQVELMARIFVSGAQFHSRISPTLLNTNELQPI